MRHQRMQETFDQTRRKPGFGEKQYAFERLDVRNPGRLRAPLHRLPRQANADALRTQRIGFCDAADGTKIAYTLIGSGAPILKAANWLNHLEFDWTTPIWGEYFSEI